MFIHVIGSDWTCLLPYNVILWYFTQVNTQLHVKIRSSCEKSILFKLWLICDPHVSVRDIVSPTQCLYMLLVVIERVYYHITLFYDVLQVNTRYFMVWIVLTSCLSNFIIHISFRKIKNLDFCLTIEIIQNMINNTDIWEYGK